jgi:uncharacterized protein (DUF1697 family)
VRYAAFLRAVNLGDETRVSMAALRDALSSAGFENVRTILQSGNVVLSSDAPSTAAVEHRVRETLVRISGRSTEVFARTPAEWSDVVASNPFGRAARDDPGHLTVLLLKSSPSTERWKALADLVSGREQTQGTGSHGYVYFPDGIGRSRLSLARIERALGTPGTLRNWNTVTKVAALLAE